MNVWTSKTNVILVYNTIKIMSKLYYHLIAFIHGLSTTFKSSTLYKININWWNIHKVLLNKLDML